MKTTNFSILSSLLLIFLVCNSCKQNTLPIAGMSGDSTSFVGDRLLLDGSSSSDADNDSLNYNWSVTSGPADAGEVLSVVEPASCLFIPVVGGNYTVELIVNDGTIDSDPVTMNIEVISFHGTWVQVSYLPPLPTPIEMIDTAVYNEDGTFEYYSYYKHQGKTGLSFIGKGNQDTPAGIREWIEYTMAVPPTMEIQTFTRDNDPYKTLERMNTQTSESKIIYMLSDGGNTLTIQGDGNNDGDFDDIQDTWSVTSDIINVWKRIE